MKTIVAIARLARTLVWGVVAPTSMFQFTTATNAVANLTLMICTKLMVRTFVPIAFVICLEREDKNDSRRTFG